jgi:hypothetical protein
MRKVFMESKDGGKERKPVQIQQKEIKKNYPHSKHTGLLPQSRNGIVRKNGSFQESAVDFWGEKQTIIHAKCITREKLQDTGTATHNLWPYARPVILEHCLSNTPKQFKSEAENEGIPNG